MAIDAVYAAQAHEIAALCQELQGLKAKNARLESELADAEAWRAQWVAAHKVAGQLQDLASDLFAALVALEREYGVDGLAGPASTFARRMHDLVPRESATPALS